MSVFVLLICNINHSTWAILLLPDVRYDLYSVSVEIDLYSFQEFLAAIKIEPDLIIRIPEEIPIYLLLRYLLPIVVHVANFG